MEVASRLGGTHFRGLENRIRSHTIQADNRKYLAGSLASGYGQIETGFGPINTRPGKQIASWDVYPVYACRAIILQGSNVTLSGVSALN